MSNIVKETTGAPTKEWQGMTLDELRQRRAIALVHRELSRERFALKVEEARHKVETNGVRGVLFKSTTITKLKTADYVLLGWRLARGLFKLRGMLRK
ncbi:MAG: hypothetical protein HUK11_09715 [Muribaculaceae bacterium]|nr:hypothetical protein [Muribaculaceae bacterium]